MKSSDFRLVVDAINVAVEHQKEELLREVDARIESHRRRVWVRDRWCCNDMEKFASAVWLAPNPPKRDEAAFGGVRLELRGHNVNYCPFCGVKV